ncbi:MAG: hypothetical protein L0229_11555 [Blastocatellia bacterium]|nr:hypothetical protein [Blastocatellia bacterium]
MSVLSFPRIYFSGYMGWDPPTANNNDYLPVYDGPNASLDWSYLATQGITPDNFKTEFRKWVIKSHTDTCPPSKPGASTPDTCTDCGTPPGEDICHMGSRWDYYGSGGCWLVEYPAGQKVTLTTGGAIAYDQPPPSGDAIIGKPIVIAGNTFGGRSSPSRLIDVNPESPWSSQIFFATIKVGDDQTSISGPKHKRMYSRRFFVPRNISSDLIIAGAIGVIFQTTIPFDQLTIENGGNSQLLAALVAGMQQPGAQGLMLRFSAFNTLYYQNGIYNGIPQQPRTCDELEAMYEKGEVFMNPAYSGIVGTFGVWNQGELVTAPGGHFLVANQPVAPVNPSLAAQLNQGELKGVVGHANVVFKEAASTVATAGAGLPPLPLGPVMIEFDGANDLVSLDMSNTIPEFTLAGDKYDYGPISVGVQIDGSFNRIGSFTNYDRQSYYATSGLVDVPFDSGVTWAQVQQWIQQGLLALQVEQSGKGVTASLELPLTAETDERGSYLDECRITELVVQVRYKNGAPPPGTKVRLAQYFPWLLNVGAGQWVLFGSTPPPGGSSPFCNAKPKGPYLKFLDGDIIDVTVPTINGSPAPYGEATVRLGHELPGFPIVQFYPFLPGQQPPAPQSQVTFSFAGYATFTIANAYYCVVRAMACDNSLVQEFVDCWNGTGSYSGGKKYDRLQAWDFIYRKILFVYDMLYPVMDQFVPLGNLERVEGAIDQLVAMISADWVDASTLYMPVTRELSAGKRLILQAWGDLVIRKYPQQPLPPIQVPCD